MTAGGVIDVHIGLIAVGVTLLAQAVWNQVGGEMRN
jgi:hypothetical protein